jgi:hypothetical protein
VPKDNQPPDWFARVSHRFIQIKFIFLEAAILIVFVGWLPGEVRHSLGF